MSWLSVRVHPPHLADPAPIAAALIGAGAEGVVDEGGSLLTYFRDDSDLEAMRSAVRTVSLEAVVQIEPADETTWVTSWIPQVGVQRVGAITVAPPWLEGEVAERAGLVIIDPAMAFGTGEHETTRGVLRLMQQVIRPGDRVVDCGAGSAVLAIAAVKLGAVWALAIEMDADAIGNATENVVRNGVAGRVVVVQGDAELLLPLAAPVRVILANIISSVLVQLSPAMRRALAPDGMAIVSGILVSERGAFLGALALDGWVLQAEHAEGEWWSGVIVPR